MPADRTVVRDAKALYVRHAIDRRKRRRDGRVARAYEMLVLPIRLATAATNSSGSMGLDMCI